VESLYVFSMTNLDRLRKVMNDQAKSGQLFRGTIVILADMWLEDAWTSFQIEQEFLGVQNVFAVVLDSRWDPSIVTVLGGASTT
jgi:hypothetical protein